MRYKKSAAIVGSVNLISPHLRWHLTKKDKCEKQTSNNHADV